MDPLAALDIASNMIQFVDYSIKLIRVREIHDSGDTKENKSLESVTSEMKRLSSKLTIPTHTPQSEDEKGLCRLAEDCQTLSGEILQLLEKIRPKDRNSVRQSVWSAFKNKLYDKKRSELETRLDKCRKQLQLQLTFLTSCETKERLDSLAKSAMEDTTKLDLLQSHFEQFRNGITMTSISTETQTQLQKLFDLSEDVYQTIARQRILKGLSFKDMHGRFEAVDTAHYQTFEWIFKDSIIEDGRDHSARESFIHWLSCGTGIFHISGKMGSGKSTLMKFLCDHDRTEAELQKWAGDRDLVVAKFFFWKPGSRLQKSLNGLFLSLLHDTLEACPELIPVVLPEQWAQIKTMPWQTQTDMTNLRKEEIQEAFSRLIEHRDYHMKHCFCFFIDGLDEYEETARKDYRDMVELLGSWTAAAPEDVKICVSSREYPVFQDYFSAERRIRLQDLTRKDIEQYISDKLENMNSEDEKVLVQSIANKADGIFLWVALVVKSIRELLNNGYSLSTLEQQLDSLPGGLAKLFKYILDSMDNLARKRAYQSFAIILKATSYTFDVSLLSYSFLEEYQIDPEFAIQSSFPDTRLDSTAEKARVDAARKRLNGCCKGLLEASGFENCISFTHRSVPEFLETRPVNDEMASYLTDFSPENAISQLALAELRSKQPGDPEILSNRVYNLLRMRKEARIEQAPYRFQERLSAIVTSTGTDPKNPWNNCGQIYHMPPGVGFYQIWSSENVVTSPLHIAALLGHHEYVSWKIQHDPDTTRTDSDKSVLLSWSIVGAVSEGNLGCFKILEFFLEGRLSPQTVLPGRNPVDGLFNVGVTEYQDVELSFWQLFIFRALAAYFPEHVESHYRQAVGRSAHRMLGQVIEKFFKYGADPEICIEAEGDESVAWVHWDWVATFTRNSRTIKGFSRDMRLGKIVWENGQISLKELIQYWNLDNNDSLLQLIDLAAEQDRRTNRLSETDEINVDAQAASIAEAQIDVNAERKNLGASFEILDQTQIAILILGVITAVVALRHWSRQ